MGASAGLAPSDEVGRPARGGHHEDHTVNGTVADLELEAADQGLGVAWRRFGLDAVASPSYGDEPVPRPLVARDGERNFTMRKGYRTG